MNVHILNVNYISSDALNIDNLYNDIDYRTHKNTPTPTSTRGACRVGRSLGFRV